VAESFVEAYYHAGGSLLVACKVTGVAYPAAVRWRAERPEFRTALAECDALVRDVVHQQFMARVLSGDEKNPAWKLAYFKKHFPEYVETQSGPTVAITVVDSTIRPLPAPPLALDAGPIEAGCTADAAST
jgi:hypothetical protein